MNSITTFLSFSLIIKTNSTESCLLLMNVFSHCSVEVCYSRKCFCSRLYLIPVIRSRVVVSECINSVSSIKTGTSAVEITVASQLFIAPSLLFRERSCEDERRSRLSCLLQCLGGCCVIRLCHSDGLRSAYCIRSTDLQCSVLRCPRCGECC
jgi:hypothetical protein